MTTSTDELGGHAGLSSAAFLHDPYPTYAWLREHAPVHFSPEWNGFLLTRYSDVVAGFRDPRLSSNRSAAYASQLPPQVQKELAPLLSNLGRWVLLSDPPDHTRLRGLLNRAFAPRLAEAMRPRLQALVDELLTQAATHEPLDSIEALAVPLPVGAIGQIMGLPAQDSPRLKQWSDALAAFIGAQPTPPVIAEALRAVQDLEQYFRDLLAERRRQPPREEDLLTSLLGAEDKGTILSEQELLSTCAVVLFGGHETTTNLIGNAAWVLAQNPAAAAALRQNPASIPAAVDEILRFESPVQRMGRVAAEDFELHGQKIKKGQRVFLVMAAANRDPEQFPHPDTLDFARTDNRHLSFGHGSHFCIGAALARLETQLAIEGLLRTLPKLELAGEAPSRIDSITIRGFKRLTLRNAGRHP